MMNRNSGIQLVSPSDASNCNCFSKWPYWKTQTSMPYAAATENRLSTTPVIATTTDRNETSNSRNASPSTKPNTHGRLASSRALKSVFTALDPVTSAVAPGTWPKVAGTTSARRWVSAWSPTRPTETTATVPAGLMCTSTGPVSSPRLLATVVLKAASCRSNAPPLTVAALTTTWAGDVLLGKAASTA